MAHHHHLPPKATKLFSTPFREKPDPKQNDRRSILLVGPSQVNKTEEKIRPYTRKWETEIMSTVDELSLRPSPASAAKRCDVRHVAPALVFSTGGYTGNVYHEFNDGLIPLYITAARFAGEVVLAVVEYHEWWFMKYRRILEKISKYEIVDLRRDKRVHCFGEMIVGLKIHGDLAIDSNLMHNGIKKTYKATKTDDVVSTVTGDALLAFRKKYYFPNDMVVKVPARSDRACSPPLGFVTVYEFSLRAGLRFPPSPELSDILMICGVSLAQLSYRAMSIIMGLIVLFRDRGAVLSPDCLARMGRLIGDTQGRISFRSKWLDIRTRDPSKSWISDFFYVKNDWNLLEKWGKMRELPIPLHLGAEELLKILKFSDIDTLHYEVRYLSRYIDEEYLFKKSAAFKIIVEDHIQEARNHIYDVEVKALEADCMEEGFIRGFMKGVRAVQRKTGAEIDGLTPSQASGDPSSDSGGEEIESELILSKSTNTTNYDIDKRSKKILINIEHLQRIMIDKKTKRKQELI
ncbi:hypothetical protein IEQ34_000155 [Dendrobium chrysotoxum]|uniref:Uncharacterized protein n=1 Tax=Dendrobium chrysotoxum TaxID=161865 RepID=A0AAV7HRZ0_DENCH|nr:hypothetical protein IEQ34_000155 [Dendrobium chrysotoxum]